MRKVLYSAGLGLLAPFVAILGAELFEVPGQNSIKEIAAGALAVALYCAACQFWLARMGSRGLHVDWPVLGAMVAPLLAVCLLAVAVEGGRTWLFFGLPVLVSGCVGSLVGALLGARGTPKKNVILSLRSCRRSLFSCAALLVAVSLMLAAVVIPQVKIDRFPAAAPERAVPVFWAIAAVNLLAAAGLVLIAVRTTGRGQSTAIASVAAFLGVVSGLLLAGPAGGFLAHGPAMRTASILLFLCVAADLIAAVLAATTVFHMPARG